MDIGKLNFFGDCFRLTGEVEKPLKRLNLDVDFSLAPGLNPVLMRAIFIMNNCFNSFQISLG
jgi:hypothetical protein